MSATLMVPEGDAGRSCAEEMIMSHEEKVEAFKSDPQLMKAASNFVTEVLEKAKEEVARRSHQNKVHIYLNHLIYFSIYFFMIFIQFSKYDNITPKIRLKCVIQYNKFKFSSKQNKTYLTKAF